MYNKQGKTQWKKKVISNRNVFLEAVSKSTKIGKENNKTVRNHICDYQYYDHMFNGNLNMT